MIRSDMDHESGVDSVAGLSIAIIVDRVLINQRGILPRSGLYHAHLRLH